MWYDKDRTDQYPEYGKDEGYQNDKNDDGYGGYEGYDQYGNYYGYDGYTGEYTGEYGEYGEYDESWNYYDYEGYYGYYDESGNFIRYNEDYNPAYISSEHLDSGADQQLYNEKTSLSQVISTTSTATTSTITTTSSLKSAFTSKASSVGNHVVTSLSQKQQQTTKPQQKSEGNLLNKFLPQLPTSISIPSVVTTTTPVTTKPTLSTITTTQSTRPFQQQQPPTTLPKTTMSQQQQQFQQQQQRAAQQQQQQQQQKQQSGGSFGFGFGMNKVNKGGLFNSITGLTSKVSDTLNTAVKEVSATAAAAAQQANKTTPPVKVTQPSKTPNILGMAGIPTPATQAKTPPVQATKTSSANRVVLTKQESVRSDHMPYDEAERRSLATLPETSDPALSIESLDQVGYDFIVLKPVICLL